jgi:hypothetical protein
MHVCRRYFSNLVIVLVLAKGAAIFWRSMGFQSLRLHRFLDHGLAMQDPGCPMAFCDFSVFWLAGRLGSAQGPDFMYDAGKFFPAAMRILPHQIANLPYMYPPPMLPVTYLISRPGLAAGFYMFSIASLGLAILLLRGARISWFAIAAGVFSSAGLMCLYLGHFGILCAAFLISGLAWLEASPAWAGALLAALFIKPQYAILVPVLLLARGDRRAWIGAGAMLAVLLALSLICYGPESWTAFLGPGRAEMRIWLQTPFGQNHEMLGTSVFWMMRSLGAGVSFAYAAQTLAEAIAAFCAWRLWRVRDFGGEARIAITICLCLLASPYSHTADMVGFCAACAMLMHRATPLANAMLAMLWLSDNYVGRCVLEFGFLPTPIFIVAVALIGWWQLRQESAPASRVIGARQSAPVLSLAPDPFHRFR